MALQELGLRRAGQIRHLVEERSAVGRLELAASAANAGRGSILDPEQLGLEKSLDKRRAVDGHERRVCCLNCEGYKKRWRPQRETVIDYQPVFRGEWVNDRYAA
jgi:hypothetical protein